MKSRIQKTEYRSQNNKAATAFMDFLFFCLLTPVF
jgi:hypothetical protein